MSGSLSQSLSGTVKIFDAVIGLGIIRDSDGNEWPFHCISIADGTRSIDIGAQVIFSTAFRVAREEAVHITLQ